MVNQTFTVPMYKDWAFRSKKSQGDLLKNHPQVTRIQVEPREKATPTVSGIPMVKVIITSSSPEFINDCFQEGKTKIMESIQYDEDKQRRKSVWREGYYEKRLQKAQDDIRAKFEGPKQQEVSRRDNSIEASLKIALNKKTFKPTVAPKVKEYSPDSNAFAALFEESDDEEFVEAQAKRNLKKAQIPKVKKTSQTKPVLTGWAKIASKAPKAPKAPLEHKKVQFKQTEVVEARGYWDEEW